MWWIREKALDKFLSVQSHGLGTGCPLSWKLFFPLSLADLSNLSCKPQLRLVPLLLLVAWEHGKLAYHTQSYHCFHDSCSAGTAIKQVLAHGTENERQNPLYVTRVSY